MELRLGTNDQLASDFEAHLKGWWESGMRADRIDPKVGDSSAVCTQLQKIPGMERIKVNPDAGGFEIAGQVESKKVDLIQVRSTLSALGYRLSPRKK